MATWQDEMAWIERHIRIMKTVGHECMIQGCHGAERRLYVEDIVHPPTGRAIDLPIRSRSPWSRPDHIHWAPRVNPEGR
jgi:hypothetical protein